MEQVLLNNGVKMPVEGFGVFQISDEAQCWQCVLDALETGYRLFDTTAAYHNEQAVGRAVRESGIPRDEIFITTKLWVQDAGYDQTLAAFERSRKKSGTGLYRSVFDPSAVRGLLRSLESYGKVIPGRYSEGHWRQQFFAGVDCRSLYEP